MYTFMSISSYSSKILKTHRKNSNTKKKTQIALKKKIAGGAKRLSECGIAGKEEDEESELDDVCVSVVCCSVLQCVAVCCSVLQCEEGELDDVYVCVCVYMYL